jgi:uncharacterized protein VirK/YbjX
MNLPFRTRGERDVDALIRWPSAREMFDNEPQLGWQRRLKYALRCMLTRAVRTHIVRDINHQPLTQTLFRHHRRAFYPLISYAMDRRMGATERLSSFQASLHRVADALGQGRTQKLLAGQRLRLSALPDGSTLTFGLNPISFHEGLWSVSMEDGLGHTLYNLSLGFLNHDSVLIASVQGPGQAQEGQERIRELTKLADGMRPPYVLMHTARTLLQVWGIQTLHGIGPDHHIKAKRNHRASRPRFDYAEFWRELGGEVTEDGNWRLPLENTLRPLEEVPTKRRAMYRRRYALLAGMVEQVNASVSADGEAHDGSPSPVSPLPMTA